MIRALALLLPVAALAQPLALGQRPNGATPEPIIFKTASKGAGTVYTLTKDGALGQVVKGLRAPRGVDCQPAVGGNTIHGTWAGSHGRVTLCERQKPG